MATATPEITMRLTVLLSMMFLLTSCAPTGNLDLYPRRQIDRPYTLPKGMAAWQPFWYSDSVKFGNRTKTTAVFNPIVWTQSLSNDLNLVWFPLPLLLRYQIYRTDRDVYGFSIGFSTFGYSSIDEWTIGGTVSGYQRHKFNDWLALVTTLSFDSVVRTKSNSSDSWGADLAVGPMFQMSDDISLLPQIHYALERNYPSVYDKPETLEGKTYSLAPLSVAISWNMSGQWELQTYYQHKSIGYPDNIREEIIAVRMSHYW